eukprot:4881325-Amphidinium_carterae.1
MVFGAFPIPSSTATRIGQLGVGHAHRSAVALTARSKLRFNNFSTSPAGRIRLHATAQAPDSTMQWVVWAN